MKYTRKNSVFNLGYHIIFTPKYRKAYLHKFEHMISRSFLKSSIKEKFIIKEIDIMPDHVHMFIRVQNTNFNISKIVKHLKGYSSYNIRKKYPKLKKYKAFWSPSYFIESIGNMSETTIRKYIKNQKINLKQDYKYKDIVQRINKEKKESIPIGKNSCDYKTKIIHNNSEQYFFSLVEKNNKCGLTYFDNTRYGIADYSIQ